MEKKKHFPGENPNPAARSAIAATHARKLRRARDTFRMEITGNVFVGAGAYSPLVVIKGTK